MTRKTKKLIYNIFACILLLGTIYWVCEKFIHLGNVEFTENAQVKQLIVPVKAIRLLLSKTPSTAIE